MKKHIFTLILLCIVVLTSCASETTGSINDTYSETYEDTGDYTDSEIYDSYCSGWNDVCEEVFTDYNELYYDDYMYSFDDYYDFVDGEPFVDEVYPETDYPYTEAELDEAYSQGREAALDTIFWDTDVLCWGEARYYRGDY